MQCNCVAFIGWLDGSHHVVLLCGIYFLHVMPVWPLWNGCDMPEYGFSHCSSLSLSHVLALLWHWQSLALLSLLHLAGGVRGIYLQANLFDVSLVFSSDCHEVLSPLLCLFLTAFRSHQSNAAVLDWVCHTGVWLMKRWDHLCYWTLLKIWKLGKQGLLLDIGLHHS